MKVKQSLIKNILGITLIGAMLFSCAPAKETDQSILNQLTKDLETLASDEMKGRATGSEGEEMAAEYIQKRFEEIKLTPKGDDNSFYQAFEFTAKKYLGENNHLILNNNTFLLNEDFYPISYSANEEVKGEAIKVGFGISAEALNYDDYKGKEEADLAGKVFIVELSSPDGVHPHSKYIDHSDVDKKIELAINKGASAVIFINSDTNLLAPEQVLSTKIFPSKIPVLFAKANAYQLLAETEAIEADISVEILKDKKKGKNVVGFIDNNAENTVVIGAHYDHLGYGKDDPFNEALGADAIHNGADDNASGTSVLISLASYFKHSDKKNNNYLFIAFSGEEIGLLGSGYFVKHPVLNIENITYMINMDMVGRLDKEKNTVLIMGSATSPQWGDAIEKAKEKTTLNIKTTAAGAGPSDQTSFYYKDIPVLHFFSGQHSDYHKPTDDIDKINYAGMLSITKLIEAVVKELDDDLKLEFTETKAPESSKSTRPKVTLGVMPDYMYEGEGMAIDGTTEGKAGQISGMKAGDVILQIGSSKVNDMGSYMKALKYFQPEDKTTIVIKRGEEKIELEVQF